MSHVKYNLLFILQLMINIAFITKRDIPINSGLLLKYLSTLIMHSLSDQNNNIFIILCQNFESFKQQAGIKFIKNELTADNQVNFFLPLKHLVQNLSVFVAPTEALHQIGGLCFLQPIVLCQGVFDDVDRVGQVRHYHFLGLEQQPKGHCNHTRTTTQL